MRVIEYPRSKYAKYECVIFWANGAVEKHYCETQEGTEVFEYEYENREGVVALAVKRLK